MVLNLRMQTKKAHTVSFSFSIILNQFVSVLLLKRQSCPPLQLCCVFRALLVAGAVTHVALELGRELKTHFSSAGLVNVQPGYVLDGIYSTGTKCKG